MRRLLRSSQCISYKQFFQEIKQELCVDPQVVLLARPAPNASANVPGNNSACHRAAVRQRQRFQSHLLLWTVSLDCHSIFIC